MMLMLDQQEKVNIVPGNAESATTQIILRDEPLENRRVPRNRIMMLQYVEGRSIEEIAAHFKLEISTIRGILSSPLVRQEMEKLSYGAVERVSNLADEAVDLVRDTMRGEVGSELRFKAATKLLDYNPELNPRKSEARDFGEGLGESMIRALGKQIREIEQVGKSTEILIEGEKDEPNQMVVGSGQV